MDRYDCGCSIGAPDYCDEHLTYSCHTLGCAPGRCADPPCVVVEGECPRCRRERWLSIGNAYRPTKTRVLRAETRGLEGMDGPGE